MSRAPIRAKRFIRAEEASTPSIEPKLDKEKNKENNPNNKKDTGNSRRSRPGGGFRSFDESSPRKPYQEPLQV